MSLFSARPAFSCAALASFLIASIPLESASAADAKAPAGDVERGHKIFSQICGICHSTEASGGPILGPNLRSIVGRKAASVPDFNMYTPALKASALTWNAATLDQFLKAPMSKVPGTTMVMMLPDNTQRADVIAYLASLKSAK